MRIVYISKSTIPSRTANSIHVMKMCQAFAQNGNEVILFAPDMKSNRETATEDVFSFYGVRECFEVRYLLPERIAVLLKGLIYGLLAGIKANRLHPDLVYGRDMAGCFFATIFNLPAIFESHGPKEGIFYRWLLLRLCSKSSFRKLIVISEALKEYYISEYGIPDYKISVAPDGADPIPDSANPIVFPMSKSRLQIGYVGHLYPGRGIDIIYQLVELCPWADFHIVGGTTEDIDKWKQRSASRENLHLYGFKIPPEAERYRIACDVLLAPYQKKVAISGGTGDRGKWMSPLKLFEYMAAGKAIVCSDIPVLREVLEDGRNGLLCDPENTDSWQKALIFLSQHPDIRIQLGYNAREDFLQKYTWSSRAKNVLVDFYFHRSAIHDGS